MRVRLIIFNAFLPITFLKKQGLLSRAFFGFLVMLFGATAPLQINLSVNRAHAIGAQRGIYLEQSYSVVHSGYSFRIEWDAKDVRRVDNNLNGVPDEIDLIAESADKSWRGIVNDMGYLKPYRWNNNRANAFRIFIDNGDPKNYLNIPTKENWAAMASIDGENSAFITLNLKNMRSSSNNNFEVFYNNYIIINSAHEFFHTVQFAYLFRNVVIPGDRRDDMLKESTARWIEKVVFPNAWSSVVATSDHTRLSLYSKGIALYPSNIDAFWGSYIFMPFFDFLSENYGPIIIKNIFEKRSQLANPDALNSYFWIGEILNSRGLDFKKLYGQYATANFSPRHFYYWGSLYENSGFRPSQEPQNQLTGQTATIYTPPITGSLMPVYQTSFHLQLLGMKFITIQLPSAIMGQTAALGINSLTLNLKSDIGTDLTAGILGIDAQNRFLVIQPLSYTTPRNSGTFQINIPANFNKLIIVPAIAAAKDINNHIIYLSLSTSAAPPQTRPVSIVSTRGIGPYIKEPDQPRIWKIKRPAQNSLRFSSIRIFNSLLVNSYNISWIQPNNRERVLIYCNLGNEMRYNPAALSNPYDYWLNPIQNFPYNNNGLQDLNQKWPFLKPADIFRNNPFLWEMGAIGPSVYGILPTNTISQDASGQIVLCPLYQGTYPSTLDILTMEDMTTPTSGNQGMGEMEGMGSFFALMLGGLFAASFLAL